LSSFKRFIQLSAIITKQSQISSTIPNTYKNYAKKQWILLGIVNIQTYMFRLRRSGKVKMELYNKRGKALREDLQC
jgi:hypothetical protein